MKRTHGLPAHCIAGEGYLYKVLLSLSLLVLLPVFALGQTPQATPPPPAPPRSGTFPKPVEQTLPNGLRVIVIERHESPLITAQMLIKNGGEVDPPELAGLADLTANLLTKGTQSRDATQIAQQIESLGGSLNSGARWDASFATVGVMSSKITPAMEILADVVRRPTFKSEEVERLRQQYLDNVRLDLGDPGTIARLVAARVVFGDSPYGHPISGTQESLTRITAADIARMHSRFYRPDNAILIIGGDTTAKDAPERDSNCIDASTEHDEDGGGPETLGGELVVPVARLQESFHLRHGRLPFVARHAAADHNRGDRRPHGDVHQ
jgi:zinc protease